MGAGASTTERTQKAAALVEILGGENNENRLSALQETEEIISSHTTQSPLSIIEEGDILPLLVKILAEEGNVTNHQEAVIRICTHFSVTVDCKLKLISEKGMIAALVGILRKCGVACKVNTLRIFGNCVLGGTTVDMPLCAIALMVPSGSLLDVLAEIIADTTTSSDVLWEATWVLAMITQVLSMPDRIGDFLSRGLHVMCLDILKMLGPDPTSWKNRREAPEMILSFFVYISLYPEAVVPLKDARAVEVLEPLVSTPDAESIKSALALTFLSGKDESTQGKASLLEENPHLIEMLVDLLEAQLSGGSGAAYDRMSSRGYGVSWCTEPISLVVRGFRALSISDANKSLLVRTRILTLLVQVLTLFHTNGGRKVWTGQLADGLAELNLGGGGDDIPAAVAAIETIVQLSFYYDSEADLKREFITPASGVETLFSELLELPEDRQLNPEAKAQINVLLTRLRPPSGMTRMLSVLQPSIESSNSACIPAAVNHQSTGSRRQHIMVSYCWSARKDLVEMLVNALCNLGYDVWRDEVGSSVVPAMSGDTAERMAQAIEHSYAVIVCVSPQYKESVNCRSEAQYCKVWKTNHGLEMMYVMMDAEYTTVSKPYGVDGWLGFLVGTELWYPLWAPDKVDSTAREIVKLVGDNARSDGNNTKGNTMMVSSSSMVASGMVTSSSSTTVMVTSVSDKNPTNSNSNRPILDFAAAWTLLQDPARVQDTAGLTATLNDLGIFESGDLEYVDDDNVTKLASYLKPIPMKRFMQYVGK